MKDFQYAAPQTEQEAVALLSPNVGETEVLAGGTDLVGLMKQMVVTPDRVVNIMEIPSLKQIEELPDGSVSIGAAVTLDEILISPYLERYPAVTQAIIGINSMQLQAQGTLGGEICQRARCWYFRSGQGLLAGGGNLAAQGENRLHAIFGNAGPAKFVSGSRVGPALVALAGHVRVVGAEEKEAKMIAAEDFFRTPRHEGQRETVLAPDELLTHIVLPPWQVANATYEVRDSAGPDYPLAAAAAALDLSGGVVREARIVLGQVAPIPWISTEAAAALIGKPVNESTATAAGEAAVTRATPLAGNQYKVQLAKVSVKRAILKAAGHETGGF